MGLVERMRSNAINGFGQSTGRDWRPEKCCQNSSQMWVAKAAQPISTSAGQQCQQTTHQLPHRRQVSIFRGILMWRLTLGFHQDELKGSNQKKKSEWLEKDICSYCCDSYSFKPEYNKTIYVHIFFLKFLARIAWIFIEASSQYQ